MRCGILQNPYDHASLILGGNGSVATSPEWHMEHAGTDHRSQIQQPLSKVCWPEMSHTDSRPVEDLFREPVVLCCMTLGVFPRGLLRHVHDALDARFLRCLGEIGGRLQNPRTNRIAEIGPTDPLHCRSHRLEVKKISDDNLGSQLLQPP